MISYKYPVTLAWLEISIGGFPISASTSSDTDLKLDNEDVLEKLHIIDDKDPNSVLLADGPDDVKEPITDPYLELANDRADDLLEILDADNDREKKFEARNFGRLNSCSLVELRLVIAIFQRKKPNPGVLQFSYVTR